MSPTLPTYVYGILGAAPVPEGARGIAGAVLHTVESDGLAALVSDLPHEEVRFGREAVTTHARVLDEALERGTVLPMRFGVVMPGEAAVRHDLLEAHRDELLRQLEALEGKVELRLRAIYEEEALMREVLASDPEVAGLRDALRGASADATYYARIRLGELVAGGVERTRERDATAILDRLEPLALGLQVADLGHERAVLTASFLLDRERMPEFDAAVDALGRERAGRIRFKYTGPLPPHSFVELAGVEA